MQKIELGNMAREGASVSNDDLIDAQESVDLYIQNENELFKTIDKIKDGKMSPADYQEFMNLEKHMFELATGVCHQVSDAASASRGDQHQTSISIV